MADEPRVSEPLPAESGQAKADSTPPTPAPPPAPEDIYDSSDPGFDPDIDSYPQPKAPPRAGVAGEGEAPAPPPPAPTHGERLLRRAGRYGITAEQLSGYTSEQVEDHLDYLHQQELLHAQQQAYQQAIQSSRQPEKPVEAPKEEDFSYLEEPVRKRIKAVDELDARNKALEKRLEQYEQREQQRERQLQADRYEAAFESLGDPFAKVFGKGSLAEVSGAEQKRRYAALTALGVDPTGLSQRQLNTALKQASEALWGGLAASPSPEPEKPAPRGINGQFMKVEDWNGGALPRPTHKKAAEEPKGEKRAAKAAASMMREMGLLSEDDDLGGFPE